MWENPDAAARCALLRRTKTIAVVGLSPNPARPSHGVAAGLQGLGFRVIPVHPAAQEILGEKVYPRLADIPEPVDLVDVFRQAEFVDGIVDECIARGVPALWLQDGIVNEPAARRARDAGITVIMDRCIWRDWQRECAP